MTDTEIEELALAHGFVKKPQPDGSMALNPYVFVFARALIYAAIKELRDARRGKGGQ